MSNLRLELERFYIEFNGEEDRQLDITLYDGHTFIDKVVIGVEDLKWLMGGPDE